MRPLPIALAATIAIGVVVPSTASAAAGWQLPKVSFKLNGLDANSGAKRCGKSKFGTWRFRGRIKGEGKVARLRWRVKLTRDGRPHRIGAVRVTGSAPNRAKRAIANSLRAQRVRYVAGASPRIESISATGAVVSRRPFNTKRKRC